MPLVTKARRRVRKPGWQKGKAPPTKEQRDSLAIQANHEQKFSRSFTAVLRDLITPKMLRLIDRAIRSNDTVEGILNAIPFFDPENPETFEIWQGFTERMERIYEGVIDETVANEKRKRGWKFDVRKIEGPEIPVNPAIGQFIRLKALSRVVDMSNKEKERIREILTEGLESGANPSSMVDEIADTVGLTAKQTARVSRKIQAAIEAGMSRDGARALRQQTADRTRLQRARAIARTESNEALVTGIQETWRQAAEQGLTPPETKKQWLAMPFEPGRSSEICQDLDGQTVGLNDTFSTTAGAGFTGAGPPAHVNCRSTLVLVFPDE